MGSVPEVRLSRGSRFVTGLMIALVASVFGLIFAGVLAILAGGYVAFHRAPNTSPAAAYEPSRDPTNPEFFAWYLVSDTPHVLVWRDAEALKEGRSLIADGTAKRNPRMVLDRLACLPDSGTRVADVSGGFLTSTVLVEEGPWTNCRGDVDNVNLSKERPAPKKD